MQFLIDLLPGLGLAVLAIIALLCTAVFRAAQRLHRLRWRSVQARTLPRACRRWKRAGLANGSFSYKRQRLMLVPIVY